MSNKYVLVCGRRKLLLHKRTHIMGILNVTPDSFSDGGKFYSVGQAVEHGIQMERDGADIIDIGGESTRPGAEKISLQEELNRVVPVIRLLSKKLKRAIISIDTYKSEVARRALDAGASMVNDISGLRFDTKMKKVVAKYKVPVVLMHIKGTPKNMQQAPVYNNLIGEIKDYLRKSIEIGMVAGIPKEKIIVDPGIGFGKTREHNLEIIRRLGEFADLGVPILVGASRKSFIGLTLNVPVAERLPGSLAAAIISALNGAHIVRVHDVKETFQAIKIVEVIRG
jgi:dihydropteroate synthase